MEYLKILAAIRAITGGRGEGAFPQREPLLHFSRSEAGEGSVVFVQDVNLSRQILQSSHYQQFNFLARTLTASDPSQFHWIRRFCEVGLIMVDGEGHRARRQAMAKFMEQCLESLARLDLDELARYISIAKDDRWTSSHHLAQLISECLFSRCAGCLAGLDDEVLRLSGSDLVLIDFFNPFPTRSALLACEAALGRCAVKCKMDGLQEDVQAAIISLLVMGVRPTIALFTVAINHFSRVLSAGRPLDEALRELDQVSSQSVVPTNFVMRKCIVDDDLRGLSVRAGDILYVFLGSASGCPFSARNSLPFGGGAHYCSGAKLTDAMFQILKGLLVGLGDELMGLECSRVRQGFASAFLAFEA